MSIRSRPLTRGGYVRKGAKREEPAQPLPPGEEVPARAEEHRELTACVAGGLLRLLRTPKARCGRRGDEGLRVDPEPAARDLPELAERRVVGGVDPLVEQEAGELLPAGRRNKARVALEPAAEANEQLRGDDPADGRGEREHNDDRGQEHRAPVRNRSGRSGQASEVN